VKTTIMYPFDELAEIKDLMISRGQTLAVAESVTSGHLQAALSLPTDASKFFQGGITAYNLGQKCRHLHVNPIHATTCNSVSQTIADEMALNCLSLFSSDWSIGITGYASPFPEFGIRDIFAFYAFGFRKEIVHRGRVENEDLGLLEVQIRFAAHVLQEFRRHVSGQ
jgi:nicotinamide-nucleotide amidase